MPRFRIWIALLLCLALQAPIASAKTILIWASKDNTLYKNSYGMRSNGSGQHFLAGNDSFGNTRLRRGLVAFPVADSIPAGSTILSVKLVLYLSSARSFQEPPINVRLHPLLQDWGEGASSISYGESEWGGSIAESGDATWVHAFYDTVLWSHQGGNWIRGESSASLSVDRIGYCTWQSVDMVADVQRWLDDPGSNFGWLLHGDENRDQTVVRFDSRENYDPTRRPVIRVDFEGDVQTHDTTWGYIKAYWR